MATAAPMRPTRAAWRHEAPPARAATTASAGLADSPLGSSPSRTSCSSVTPTLTSCALPRHALAEETRRPEDEDEDKHREGHHVLQLAHGRDPQARQEQDGPDGLDLAEEDAAQHRARNVADAAQHGGREGLD